MPPKLPFMRFMPRADARGTRDDEEPVVSAFHQQRPTAAAAAAAGTPEASGGPEGGASNAPRRTRAEEVAAATAALSGGGGGGGRGGGGRPPRTFTIKKQAAEGTFYPSAKPEDLPPNTMLAMESYLGDADEKDAFLPIIPPVPPPQGGPGADAHARTAAEGVEFLEAEAKDVAAARNTNRDFFEDVASAGNEAQPRIWLQLPSPPVGGGGVDLTNMAPGRIGRLRVFKSGRAELVINGVAFAVTMDPSSSGGVDGIQQHVVAIQSRTLGSSEQSCYDLGPVGHKAICTPEIPR